MLIFKDSYTWTSLSKKHIYTVASIEIAHLDKQNVLLSRQLALTKK